MLIITGLFFNKKGNQSFYNSVKGYTKEYKVTIVTAATLSSDVYVSLEKIRMDMTGVKIISVFPYRFFNFLLRLIYSLRKITFFKVSRKVDFSEKSDNSHENKMLVNLPPTFKSKISFYLRSYLLAAYCICYKLFNKFDLVCCYEINGAIASVAIKKLFKIPVFIKLQGTALGGQLSLIGTENFNRIFSIDIAEIKRSLFFDLAIMTNDGTRGETVLRYFGFEAGKILFLNNGIDNRFENVRSRSFPLFLNEDLKAVKICSVSRLTPWKRVDLILEVISELRNKIDVHYTLVGVGDETEVQTILKIIEKLKLENNVTFIKGAPTEEVVSVISNSDLLISLNKFTNVSNPVFEALYLGVPVVTVYQTEFTEVLGPGVESCIFVEEGDKSIMINNIVQDISCMSKTHYKKMTNNKDNFKNYFPTWEVRSSKELNRISSLSR